MTNEVKSDLTRIMHRQYLLGYTEGQKRGFENGKQFVVKAHREGMIFAFSIGAVLGILAGASL
jgi:hypothetical protein